MKVKLESTSSSSSEDSFCGSDEMSGQPADMVLALRPIITEASM